MQQLRNDASLQQLDLEPFRDLIIKEPDVADVHVICHHY